MPGNKLGVKQTLAAGFRGSERQFMHHWRMLRDHVPFRFARSPQAEMCGLTAMDPIRIATSRILISISRTSPHRRSRTFKTLAAKIVPTGAAKPRYRDNPLT
jgi:hypothetical protein